MNGPPSPRDSAFADAITRCPCGDNEDTEGFMIQCESCDVWQHGNCIGIDAQHVPEKYHCELCAPNDPVHIRNAEVFRNFAAANSVPVPARRTPGPTRRTNPPNKRRRPARPRNPRPMGTDPLPEEDNRKRIKPETQDGEASHPVSVDHVAIPMPNSVIGTVVSATTVPNGVAPYPATPVESPQTIDGSSSSRASSREIRKIQQQIRIMNRDVKTPKILGGPRGSTTPTSPPIPDSFQSAYTYTDRLPSTDQPAIAVPPPAASPSASSSRRRVTLQGQTSPSGSTHSRSSSPPCVSGVMSVPPPKPRHLHSLGMMYLGKKSWIMNSYKETLHEQSTPNPSLTELALPVNKRVVVALAPMPNGIDFGHSGSSSAQNGLSSSLGRLVGLLPAHPRSAVIERQQFLNRHSSALESPRRPYGSPEFSTKGAPHNQSPTHYMDWHPPPRMSMFPGSPVDYSDIRSPTYNSSNMDSLTRHITTGSGMDLDNVASHAAIAISAQSGATPLDSHRESSLSPTGDVDMGQNDSHHKAGFLSSDPSQHASADESRSMLPSPAVSTPTSTLSNPVVMNGTTNQIPHEGHQGIVSWQNGKVPVTSAKLEGDVPTPVLPRDAAIHHKLPPVLSDMEQLGHGRVFEKHSGLGLLQTSTAGAV